MKTCFTILLAIVAGLDSALAEDVKLTSGGALHDVTVNWADEAGVWMTTPASPVMPNKYPWASIHPDDRQRLQTIALAVMAKVRQSEKVVEGSSIFVAVEVISIEDKGIVARTAKAVPSLASTDPAHQEYTVGALDEEPVFIFLADTSGLAEGKTGLQKLYPVGTCQQSGHTYRAYVTRADDAAAILAAQKK